MRFKISLDRSAAIGGAAFLMTLAPMLASAQSLEEGFRTPPESARPRVWWHWLSGNIAKPGITLDLEWMKRVGLGGMQMFDGDLGSPTIVPSRIAALTPEWREHLRFAASEADRLGLEFAMAAAPGWSETGGPWVAPEAAMKKLVWSETRVTGGRAFTGALARPPSTSGPFQGLPRTAGSLRGIEPPSVPERYRDVSVLAFRAPTGDVALADLKPRVTTSAADVEATRLYDGDIVAPVVFPQPSIEAPVWVQYAFDRPQTIRALTMVGPQAARFNTGPNGRIEVSDDGRAWTPVAPLTGPAHTPAPQRTYAFPPATGRFFRILFDTPRSAGGFGGGGGPGFRVAELALEPRARVNHIEDKAGFGIAAESDTTRTPEQGADVAIPRDGVVDLTSRMRADGTLDWTPPAGDWVVLRMGWSLTGTVNHPATDEATGPEVDKLSAEHVAAHLDGYLRPVLDTLGPLSGTKGLRYILTDSWEAGVQNWTEAMADEFRKRRGYAMTPFLPALAGRVVESPEASDKFLWDYRRTLADLLAENHYGTITAYAKSKGLGYYGEAVGTSWPALADGMLAKSYTDIPMGEFWAIPFGGQPAAFQGARSDEFPADVAEAASTSHIYGKRLVAAEALTSSQPMYTTTPWALKWVADKYMAMGVNRLILHTSPHQPGAGMAPGLTLGGFGQTFTRLETWGEMAKPWIDYLSRSSFMLQQGVNVADVAYFYGEGAPSGVPYREAQDPAVPEGFAYDYVNADALLRLALVRDGRIVFPGGASYRLLVLPSALDRLTLPTLRKLEQLVRAGATVVGPRPFASPSLADDSAAVRTLALSLWGQADGRTLTRQRYGAGAVYWGAPLAQVLSEIGLAPDFRHSRPSAQTRIVFNHRRTDDADIYFVSNQTNRTEALDLDLRVAGRDVQIWRADTGAATPASYRTVGERTAVPLALEPYEAVFVVMRGAATAPARTVPAAKRRTLTTLTGPWTIAFQADRGAPPTITLPALGSWSDQADPGVKYFSGTGTYRRTLNVPAAWLGKGRRIVLNLGEVAELAEVTVNGASAGVAWKPPYEVDVTDAVRAGANTLEIKVANLWRNRIVGDLQPGVTTKVAFTGAPISPTNVIGGPISKDTPLLKSGLLGPVILVSLGQ